jgi:hypothetical protein
MAPNLEARDRVFAALVDGRTGGIRHPHVASLAPDGTGDEWNLDAILSWQ